MDLQMERTVADLGCDFPRQVSEAQSRLGTAGPKKTEGYRCHGKRWWMSECCSRSVIDHRPGSTVVHNWDLQ